MRGIYLYKRFDAIFGNSYQLKIFSVCFAGMSTPLLALIAYSVCDEKGARAHSYELSVTLFATLLGTLVIFIGIWMLLEPLELAIDALRVYRDEGDILPLPREYKDSAGTLLDGVYSLLVEVDNLISNSERLAFSDPLTGLMNRRCFDLVANDEFNSDWTPRGPIHLAICDLDNLKDVNNEFGRPMGDRVLKEFAEVLRRAVKPEHMLARIGEDEFVVVFFGMPADDVETICQHTRHLMARREIVPFPLTTSIGVTLRRPAETISETITRADRALYRAKREGRNRVIMDRPPVFRLAAE
jgi:diguanylate cyclase (GGDEF)-like protein